MLDPAPYEEYFGFTEEEIANIVQQPFCTLSQQELKEWYQGYKLKGIDIYNPNSVAIAVAKNYCQSYWSNTSSSEEVVRLINMNFRGIKSDIATLIAGARVKFNSTTFQNDMVSINNKNDIFCLLVCLGYLGCSDEKNSKRASRKKDGSTSKIAYVPNLEVREFLKDLVRDQSWYYRLKAVKRSEQLLKAMQNLDGATVATLIQDIHNSPAVGLLDYNDEESLTYCVMIGLYWATLDTYDAYREDPACKGRADLVYEPFAEEDPVIMIEFKYNNSAEIALAQIKTKEYYKRYQKYRNIILVGINYDLDTKEHQCVLEKMTNRRR